jgi:2-oxoglutarate dehydrogenase E2 component (dihydrolipoamide succinyltransferase)
MSSEIRVPSPGESISEVTVAAWLKADGEHVERDEEILELESEKATLQVVAEAEGVLRIGVEAGAVVQVGSVVGRIEAGDPGARPAERPSPRPAPAAVATAPPASPAGGGVIASPAAAKLLDEHGLDRSALAGSGKDGRITKGDVLAAIGAGTAGEPATAQPKASTPVAPSAPAGASKETRQPMSELRRKLAARLVEARNAMAMLTTFNEADLGAIKELRARYKERFAERHETGLGVLSFFAAAACRALAEYPLVNSRIEDHQIVTPAGVDLGIAVSAPKGLVVPVIRGAQVLGLDGLEREIARLAGRARENRISIDEMSGGSFTISNGGVFGSLLSTPIVNPPQTAILGLHAIQDRPVARDGQVVIRPMMYLALSYDHRLIDGRESVGFLKRIKELVEDPMRLLLNV